MAKMAKLNIKKIIKKNPLIEEKKFAKERALILSRRGMSKPTEYNIVPPFTTQRQITTSLDSNDEKDKKCANY